MAQKIDLSDPLASLISKHLQREQRLRQQLSSLTQQHREVKGDLDNVLDVIKDTYGIDIELGDITEIKEDGSILIENGDE
mgnify:CR=1 FL=1